MLEMETGVGYVNPTEKLHKDPMKMAQIPQNEIDPLAQARLDSIITQIEDADLDTFDDILGNIIEAMRNKPELRNSPEFQAKLEAAVTKLQAIIATKH